jgi:hypothetical protein
MSFLSGGHMDWKYYIQIEKADFFSLWNESIEITDIYSKFSDVYMSWQESAEIDKKFGLTNVRNMHQLPKAGEQMFVKSLI